MGEAGPQEAAQNPLTYLAEGLLLLGFLAFLWAQPTSRRWRKPSVSMVWVGVGEVMDEVASPTQSPQAAQKGGGRGG